MRMMIESFLDQMRHEGLDTEALSSVKALGGDVFTCRYYGKNTVTTMQVKPIVGIVILSVEVECAR